MFKLRRQFLIDPEVIFLNHGSFGATPKPVFRAYRRWQRELERQPVEFLARRATGLLREARTILAAYLHTETDNLVFTTNVTVSINIVARSLELGPGDEVLSSDHEYGACDRTWRFLAGQRGFAYINQPIPVPVTTPEAMIEALWRGVTARTRVIFLSHITSTTALIFPVAEICRRARQAGILTVVDGAHAPGQIPLDLEAIGADFYGGNLHKWLCAPKGAGFLYARRAVQDLLKPLVVSWGYEPEVPGASRFVDLYEWEGTRDLAAFLAVPDAIKFQADHDWDSVRAACHEMVGRAQAGIAQLSGLSLLQNDDPLWNAQMGTAPLPASTDLERLKARLYDRYHIEVPLSPWNGQKLIRVSVQGYNTARDITILLQALRALLS